MEEGAGDAVVDDQGAGWHGVDEGDGKAEEERGGGGEGRGGRS